MAGSLCENAGGGKRKRQKMKQPSWVSMLLARHILPVPSCLGQWEAGRQRARFSRGARGWRLKLVLWHKEAHLVTEVSRLAAL